MQDWSPEDDKGNSRPNPPQENKVPEKQVKSVPEEPNRAVNNDIYDIITDLPTGGKLYPNGTEIKARSLKVAEVKMLANMDENNGNDIVNEILKRTVIGIDVENIYSADKLYIMFWLRSSTYKESGYNVKFECMKCNSISEFEFELEKLDVKELTEENIEFLNNEFVLPNKDKIRFKLLTVKDENDNHKFLKDNENSLMAFDEEIVNTCRMIESINGEKKGMIDKYMYLTETLDPANYSYLESYLESKSVGLEPTIEVVCKKCGGASETMLPFRPDFFLPKIRV